MYNQLKQKYYDLLERKKQNNKLEHVTSEAFVRHFIKKENQPCLLARRAYAKEVGLPENEWKTLFV